MYRTAVDYSEKWRFKAKQDKKKSSYLKRKKVTFLSLLCLVIPNTCLNWKLRILHRLRCLSAVLVTLNELRVCQHTLHLPLAHFSQYVLCQFLNAIKSSTCQTLSVNLNSSDLHISNQWTKLLRNSPCKTCLGTGGFCFWDSVIWITTTKDLHSYVVMIYCCFNER